MILTLHPDDWDAVSEEDRETIRGILVSTGLAPEDVEIVTDPEAPRVEY